MKMSCDKMDASLLQDLLDNTIDPLEKIFVESHLTICKECRRELSELKLMLWELNNKSNYDTEIPKELDTLGDKLINDFLGMEQKSIIRQAIDMQVNAIKISGKLFEYIPGAKETPKALKKASRSLAKGVKKMLIAK
jgi:hypothetical protein